MLDPFDPTFATKAPRDSHGETAAPNPNLNAFTTTVLRDEIACREGQAYHAAVEALNNLTKKSAINAILACDHNFKSVTSER